jgi:hypothetical protein
MTNPANNAPFEATAVAQSSVVAGLGYPNGRTESSPEPTGWQPNTSEISVIEKKVSRETI